MVTKARSRGADVGQCQQRHSREGKSKVLRARRHLPLSQRIETLSIHLVLLVCTVTTLVPFLWMVSTSLKTDRDLFRYPPRLIPNPITYERYPAAFRDLPLVRGLLNSAKIAVLSTAGTVLSSSLAGYAFAKIRFKLRQGIFGVFLATLMIPWQVTLIPLYVTFSRIGWVDTHLPLIVPKVLMNAYGVFLMKQFIQRIPDDYIESAQIDGANHARIFWSIILPLVEPPLITLGLFSFIGSWNSFLSPLIYLNTASKFTVQLVINTLRTVYYTEWGLLMAAATIAILPILALYSVAQRYFIQGITLSGLKG